MFKKIKDQKNEGNLFHLLIRVPLDYFLLSLRERIKVG